LKIAAGLLLLCLTAVADAPASAPASNADVRVTLATELGDITLEIYLSRAPLSAGSFLAHVDKGLYENAMFYRVVSPDNDNGDPVISVVQGGVPDDDESLPPVTLETTKMTGITHQDGVISLARGAPDSGSGAAFFICLGAQPSLDFGGMRNPDGLGFAAFGRVVAGMDVVRDIHRQDADGHSDSPYTQGQMLSKPVLILKASREVAEPLK
jgi:peptidyl-prolyl cis-trans isomerase A (cyclophilin A)